MSWFYLPITIVVTSNVIYDVSAKSIREDLNAYAGTAIIYSILAVFNLLLFVMLNPDRLLGVELAHMNWAIVTFAIASIGLESGYIFLYRAGWNISLGGMVCNILLAMSMLLVGQLFFNETVSFRQYLGVLFCVIGLIIIFQAGSKKTPYQEDNGMFTMKSKATA